MRTLLGFLPRPLRLALFGLAVGAILWASLAPQDEVPGAKLIWDKASHAIAYGLLTLAGLLLSTHRRGLVVLSVWALGLGVEGLQALMALGRQGDWRDALANTLGGAGALGVWAFARRWMTLHRAQGPARHDGARDAPKTEPDPAA